MHKRNYGNTGERESQDGNNLLTVTSKRLRYTQNATHVDGRFQDKHKRL